MKTARDSFQALLVVCLCISAPAGAKLIQHLDASVPESVIVSGGVVQQWNDLSGNNNNAVKSIGTVTYPSAAFPGGPVGLDFGLQRNSLQLFTADASKQWLDLSAGTGGFTVVVVTYTSAMLGTWNDVIGNTSSVANGWGFRYNESGSYVAYLHGNTGGGSPNGAIEAGDTTVWTHTYNAATGASELWTNQGDPRIGTSAASNFSSGSVTLGTTSNNSRYFQGSVGEVMIFDLPLSQAELEQLRADLIYKWVTPMQEKLAPGALLPADGSVEMPLDGVILSWKPGMNSTAQDVYFGTDFDTVSTATPDNDTAGVYKRRQTETSFALPPLDYGQTYYWRVDSINGGTAYSSAVVSFDTIKYAYRMASEYITAAASSSIEDVNAINTVNGAGLNADNLHNTNLNDMWLSNLEAKGTPVWIRYDFGTLVKLNEMLVWNHNTLVESLMGWGIKDAEIDYTADGTTWRPLTEQPVTFEQGPGKDGYAANTAVAFNDLAVQAVRITALSNFEGIVPLNMYGLSEVQFLTVPVQAADPVPANGQTAVSVAPTLSWGAGRGAVSHTLYVSDDPNAVANETIAPIAVGLTDATYDVAGLNMNTVYYWKVNEVGDTETWPGYVWSFTTADSIVVDNMEFYRDVEGRWIWQTWVDGFQNPANGSTVGNGDLPETQIVHSGNQSLPMAFDNSSSPVSEATRTFDPAQDWTRSGIQKLALYYRFSPESTGGQLYIKINGVKAAAVPVAVVDAWSPIVVDLTGAGTDLSKVGTLTIGVDGAGAKGIVYIDDIVLTN